MAILVRLSYDRSIPLEAFSEDARALDADAFADKHGRAFLVRSANDGELEEPKRLGQDDWMKPTQDVLATKMAPVYRTGEEAQPVSGDRYFVYPVRKRGAAKGGRVTVGRTPNNDIVIGDVSLSKSHAAFQVTVQGNLALMDLGSRNGTAIASTSLAPNRPYKVPFGKALRFGRVRLTYMETAQFVDFVKLMAG